MNNHRNEYYGNGKGCQRGKYRPLKKTDYYSCPKQEPWYPGFSHGQNCLCANAFLVRSSFDEAVEKGKTWPVSNDTLGWKKT